MIRKVKPIHQRCNVGFVLLTKGYEAKIDISDIDFIGQFNWFAFTLKNGVYAARTSSPDKNGKRYTIFMHRDLIKPDKHMLIDHKDRDGLNNQRINLRVATPAQNQYNQPLPVNNTSGFKGVCYRKDRDKWQASITINGVQKNLGLFNTAKLASNAYNNVAYSLHGPFRFEHNGA